MSQLPAIPEPGGLISADQCLEIEIGVAANLDSLKDIPTAEDYRLRAKAIEAYLRDPSMQKPILSAQRHIEAKIGLLLGEPKPGTRTDRQPRHHDDEVNMPNQTLTDFRLLARALNGDCKLEPLEWRKSRRALVALLRERLDLHPPLPILPEGIFRCIVADPPWEQPTGPQTWGTTIAPSTPLDYPTMSRENIQNMNVAARAADDAHLYLWTTNRYLEASYGIARAWGFTPSTMLVWAKTPHGLGLGGDFRLTTEFILFARRGSLEALKKCETTWFNWQRGRHSEKPKEFYDLVESMTPAPHGDKDRLEIFGREKREGWTVFGDEV
jgi:N6-adenosine-specific RNA methylase IME4